MIGPDERWKYLYLAKSRWLGAIMGSTLGKEGVVDGIRTRVGERPFLIFHTEQCSIVFTV